MNFNEKLIELRKSKHLSQEELGHEIGVSRQTVSKWESGQSYPDFHGLTLDELVHDLDVQDVRDKNLSAERLNSIYNDVGFAKKCVKWWIIIVGIAVGIVLLLILYFFVNVLFVW